MTDERMGDRLRAALVRLPRGGGVIFRHHAAPPAERRRLFAAVRQIARRRGLVLVLAGSVRDAIGWRADGVHGRSRHVTGPRGLLRTAPVHDARELVAATRAKADIALVSPVFPTRSHPGAPSLGVLRFGLLANAGPRRGRGTGSTGPRPAPGNPLLITLGGMDARRFRRVHPLGTHGWAAIDAWLPGIGQDHRKPRPARSS